MQPSQRIFPDSQYERAGAVITEDLSCADVLLGVKRVADEDNLIPDKTYMFFSHVIKGQPENMNLLKVCSTICIACRDAREPRTYRMFLR